MELHGYLEFYAETGTEGGHWAFRDENGTHTSVDLVDGKCPFGAKNCPVVLGTYFEHTTHESLYILRDGDKLTVFEGAKSDIVAWSGVIELIHHPAFTEEVFGWWIHADQAGTPRKTWASMFFDGCPATLIRDEVAAS